jgi:exosortase H (IPTLxxWG-CTERM-specific)
MKEKIKALAQRNAESVRFLVIFFILLALFFWMFDTKAFENVAANPFTSALARVSVWTINLLGGKAQANGTVISTPAGGMTIKYNCNGLEAIAIFVAAILAFPATWKAKMKGLVMGFAVIQVVNVIRIVVLYYVQKTAPEAFDTVHVYVAQIVVIAIAIGLWLLWIERYAPPKSSKVPI